MPNSKLITLMFSAKRSLMGHFKDKKGFNPVIYIKAEILKFLQDNQTSKMKDVANYLGITPPSATTMIDKLVQEKYLSRKQDPNDRRQVLLIVTNKGKTFIHTSFENMRKILDKTLDVLSDKDKKDLIRIYNKLLKL